jgi:hypothetical protein
VDAGTWQQRRVIIFAAVRTGRGNVVALSLWLRELQSRIERSSAIRRKGFAYLGDFLFGAEDQTSGVFVFEKGSVLAGVEVYGFAGDAPKSLPAPEALRPY